MWVRRLAKAYPIEAADLEELLKTACHVLDSYCVPCTIKRAAPKPQSAVHRLAKAYSIGAADLEELQNTVYRVFNQTEIMLPGSLLGNASSLQAAVLSSSGGSVAEAACVCHGRST